MAAPRGRPGRPPGRPPPGAGPHRVHPGRARRRHWRPRGRRGRRPAAPVPPGPVRTPSAAARRGGARRPCPRAHRRRLAGQPHTGPRGGRPLTREAWGHVASALLVGGLVAGLARVGGQLVLTPSLLAGAAAALVWAALTWALRHGAGGRSWPDPPDPERLAGWPHVAMTTRRLEREADRRVGPRPRRRTTREDA